MGLKAWCDIPSGCLILSMSTSLSQDVIPKEMVGISVIQAGRGQNGPTGPWLMLGPLRLANHDCKPNFQVCISFFFFWLECLVRLDPEHNGIPCIYALVYHWNWKWFIHNFLLYAWCIIFLWWMQMCFLPSWLATQYHLSANHKGGNLLQSWGMAVNGQDKIA